MPRFSVWTQTVLTKVTSLASDDAFALATNTPEAKAIERDDLIADISSDVLDELPLTTNGDLLTQAAGARARLTRADLAADIATDTAFVGKYGSARQVVNSGWWHAPAGNISVASPAVNIMFLTPMWVPGAGVSVDRIAVEVTTAGSAGAVARLGLYNSDANGWPTNRIVDAGTVATDTTGVKEITISETLSGGVVWLACVSQVAVSTYRAQPTNGAAPNFISAQSSTVALGFAITGLTRTGVSGGLPSPASMTGASAGPPRISVRFV